MKKIPAIGFDARRVSENTPIHLLANGKDDRIRLYKEAAAAVVAQLKAVGGRVELYDQNEPMRVKIAKAQSQKIPYMIVLGDKEVEDGTVSVRERHEGDLGTWEVSKLVDVIKDAAL